MIERTVMEPRQQRWQLILDATVSASALVVAFVVVYSFSTRSDAGEGSTPELPIPTEPVSIERAAFKGDPAAKVVLIEYVDFECQFCRSFANETLPLLQKQYIDTGQILFALKHLPLPRNRHAAVAAAASECAGRQNKFWAMHDWIFANPARLETIAQNAVADLHLDSRFRTCLEEDSISARIQQDRAEARHFRITSTPTFLVGTKEPDGRVTVSRRIPGAVPLNVFVAAIDQVLQRTSP